MLKMVVLPAPFGPMRPLMSPSGISNEALLTARRPRNDLLMPRTSSRGIGAFHAAAPRKEEQYQRHDRDDPQQGVDEQQVDANVAIAAARNAGVVQDLEDRVGGPAKRGDQHGDATIEQEEASEDGGRNKGARRPADEHGERLENEIVPVHRRNLRASVGQMPCGRNITTRSSPTP